jgi:hypothetical protein
MQATSFDAPTISTLPELVPLLLLLVFVLACLGGLGVLVVCGINAAKKRRNTGKVEEKPKVHTLL